SSTRRRLRSMSRRRRRFTGSLNSGFQPPLWYPLGTARRCRPSTSAGSRSFATVSDLACARPHSSRRRNDRHRREKHNARRLGRAAGRGIFVDERSYLRLVIAVRSNLPETTKVELHQFEPTPLGLIAVKLPENRAVWSLVKALQSPLLRLVS